MAESIGATLKQARQRRGLRVKDVAGRTSARISPSYLSCIENDLRLPSEELLLELADVLGLNRRSLYMELVRAKAPAGIRDVVLEGPGEQDADYAALREQRLEDVVQRAREATDAQREVQRLRRELSQLRRRTTVEATREGHLDRWHHDAGRYRMLVEKAVFEARLTIDGDMELHRHVIGLTPRPGRKPIVAIQHIAQILDLPGTTGQESFKLLEQPDDVAVEVESEKLGPDRSLFRILFPDGLRHSKGSDRRVSYSCRTALRGAYSMARADARQVADTLRDDRGGRSIFIVYIDKPHEGVEIELRFPRYYVPDGVEAWAGTQEFFDTDDNFIDSACESWRLEHREGERTVLAIDRPTVGMKFGIVWRPLFQDEYTRVRQRLEEESEP